MQVTPSFFTKFPPKVQSLMSPMKFWTKRWWFPFNPAPLILELIFVFRCRQNVTTISVTTVGAAEKCHKLFLFSMQENALEIILKKMLWRRIPSAFYGKGTQEKTFQKCLTCFFCFTIQYPPVTKHNDILDYDQS